MCSFACSLAVLLRIKAKESAAIPTESAKLYRHAAHCRAWLMKTEGCDKKTNLENLRGRALQSRLVTVFRISHFAGITKMIVYLDKVDLTWRWWVSEDPTLSSSTSWLAPFHLSRDTFLLPLDRLLSLFLSSLFLHLVFFSILHRAVRKRSRFGPITTRPKSYVEFICRRRQRAARRDTTRYSSRPNPRTRASDGGNILSLFNLAACASPRQMYTDDFY